MRVLVLAVALSAPAEARKPKGGAAAAPAAAPKQAPNVAAQYMPEACERTRMMGRDALKKALDTANGQGHRGGDGETIWDHFAVMQANGIKVGVDISLPSTMKVDRAGVQAYTDACMANQGKDNSALQACAPKVQEVNMAFAGIQSAVLDTGMAFLLANNIATGCYQQALTTLANAERTNLMGGGEPDYAADKPHYMKNLEGAKQGHALSAGVNSLIATYQAIGDGALTPEAARPLLEALPEVLDMPVEVTEDDWVQLSQLAKAEAASDPNIQQAIKDLEAWSRDNGGVKPAAPGKGLGGALQAVVSGLASGNLSEAAQGIVGMLHEDNPSRAGVTCVTALLDRDFKTAFRSARNLLPQGSKLRAALDIVPV